MQFQFHSCLSNPAAQTIVLSSGLGGHGSFWQPQLAALQQNYHVLTYDQDGCHADAAPLNTDYAMQDMAEQVVQLLKHIGIHSFHFIGHALGGHIGIELARLLHEQADIQMLSLTCINAWDRLDPHTEKCFSTRIHLLKNSGAEAYVWAQALFLYPPQWISDHIELLTQAENTQLLNFPPTHNILARLKALQEFLVTKSHAEALQNIPVHLIANNDDFLVPVKKSSDLQHCIGTGTLSILETGAHASTHTETEKINVMILSFLVNKCG